MVKKTTARRSKSQPYFSSPDHEDHEAGEHHDEDGRVTPARARARVLLHDLRLGPGTSGIQHGGRQPDRDGRDQEGHSELPAGGQLQIGHLLGDPDLEGIERAEAGADQRSAQAHGDGDHRREAEPPGEEEEDGDEGDQLLFHLDQHAAGRERQAGERDDQQASPGEGADHRVHQPGESSGPVHHREGSPDQEHVEDDQACIHHPLGNRVERVEETRRAWRAWGRRCPGRRDSGRSPGPRDARTSRPEGSRSERRRGGYS